ncbi:MAG TPA: glycosyltransferase family 4 protein [Sedimentisphaerales bacterium]|nr:glycosyltransferase family 4 protein [Sedimentisphaerales bacterium]HRS11263.1 glycosyltransferase family 4 protein [Sedimentisphaerales bacterium]HRV47841.1 glycosyltransferase family 4 protein [Sedimentisphaerales bacterium]
MHILYIHQYFASRKGRTGTRSYEFGCHLVGKGHRVTMITSGLANAEFPAPQGRRYGLHEIDGIRVVSIAGGYNDPHLGTALNGWRRMFKFYEFARVASKVARELNRPDVVFATHTPLTVGLAGIAVSRCFGVPFVFEVRDLWPEALVDVGVLNNPLAIWWLRRMARKIYRRADHIVALSPGMKEGIVQAGVADSRVTVIPNASDLDLFRPDLDGTAARHRLGLGDRFAALYFGAMGLANGLEYVIEAARVLAERKQDHIVLVLQGGGGKRDELEAMARRYNLQNVVFGDLVPKEEIAGIVAGCDVCLTIVRGGKNPTWSPNKMFDSLAAGKPVLINAGGWLAEMIERNACGRFVAPDRPAALAEALMELSRNPSLCAEMGRNARLLAEREFDRKLLAARLESLLAQVVARANAGPGGVMGE